VLKFERVKIIHLDISAIFSRDPLNWNGVTPSGIIPVSDGVDFTRGSN